MAWDGAHIIEIEGLWTKFGDHVVHRGVDLKVKPGEILALVGGSGSGKTTLLRQMLGLERPHQGSVAVFGQRLDTADRRALNALRNRWGVLFQEGALFSGLTVAQNVQVPMREHLHLPQALMDQLAAVKIGLVGLPQDAGAKFPSQLSGGMKKRAGLARALALDPEIVFLDEPTAGLDPIGASAFDQLILQLKDTMGLTVFMVTHDLDSLHAICDRIAVLAERRVLVTGTMDDMLKQDHPWIREYFHGPRARAATGAWGGNAPHAAKAGA